MRRFAGLSECWLYGTVAAVRFWVSGIERLDDADARAGDVVLCAAVAAFVGYREPERLFLVFVERCRQGEMRDVGASWHDDDVGVVRAIVGVEVGDGRVDDRDVAWIRVLEEIEDARRAPAAGYIVVHAGDLRS